tara:strand:+ start:64 stop:378 length:315 start_codon:yes stop_codon:yes gene_type:complete
MAVTIDTRPTYFGDRMVVTGSYETGDTTIDLSSLLISIDMATLTPTGALAPQTLETGDNADASDSAPFDLVEFATASGTTITVNVPGAGQAIVGGRFLAIGRRS